MLIVLKKIAKIILIILMILCVFILAIFINHKYQLNKERNLFKPMGQMVEVDGHKMSVLVKGHRDKTLVFMSGGGTSSPILDFKSLYSQLENNYKIVVVEKFGYGFSDVLDKERDIDSILDDTRNALKAVNVKGPYVLCPHSMSGIEALYWLQKYPDEVDSIIGLDMAVPQAYEDYEINIPMINLASFASKVGFTRLLPDLSESEAIKHGNLTSHEKEVYKAVFYRRTATVTMMTEVKKIKENARKIDFKKLAQRPILLFISNGNGTGWDKKQWVASQKDFAKELDKVNIIEINSSHYVHDFDYKRMARDIKGFLK